MGASHSASVGRSLPALAALLTLASLLRLSSGAASLKPITYPTYGEMVARMEALAASAPELVQMWNAQDTYGVASPGDCTAVGGGRTPCKHWFLRITALAPPAGTAARRVLDNALSSRPQVFLSGNLHGDETVGPMTLIHLAELLVSAYKTGANPWLVDLVTTRHLVLIPITNPWGWDRIRRDENGMDPNRDFPYDQDPSRCMTTTVARALNEVFRAHLFTSAITFHGGMQAVAYEWGAPNHQDADSRSPDDVSQAVLSHIMAAAAGTYAGGHYPVDRMNKVVYAVHGGMEDWAYASSWDTGAVKGCNPTTYGGYPADRTVYNDAVLRAVNVLVEAADDKRPAESNLGRWDSSPNGGASLQVEGEGDGHVPRNVRLTLALIDLAAPLLKTTTAVTGVAQAGSYVRRMAEGSGSSGEAAWAAARAAHVELQQAIAAAVKRASSGSDAAAPPAAAAVPRSAAAGDAAATLYGAGSTTTTSGGLGGSLVHDLAASFSGPGPCSITVAAELGGVGGACGAHRAAYANWVATGGGGTAAPETATWVDWDVSGAVTIDATGLVGGTWDARLPPSLLLEADAGPLALPPAGVPEATTAFTAAVASAQAALATTLTQQYGLSSQEASQMAVYIHAWQLFLAGQTPLARLPASVAPYRTSNPARGVSRWVFGEVGAQPVAGAGSNTGSSSGGGLSAPVPAGGVPDRLGGNREAPATHTQGAPDLAVHPYVPRFGDGVCVDASGLLGAAAAATPAEALDAARSYVAAGQLLRPCPAPQWRTPPLRALAEAEGARAAAADTASGVAPSVLAVVQPVFFVPYAVVDSDWATTGTGAVSPAGARPQTHLANARTNASWVFRSGQWEIVGRTHTVGEPLFFAFEARGVLAPAAPAPPAPSLPPATGGSGGKGSGSSSSGSKGGSTTGGSTNSGGGILVVGDDTAAVAGSGSSAATAAAAFVGGLAAGAVAFYCWRLLVSAAARARLARESAAVVAMFAAELEEEDEDGGEGGAAHADAAADAAAERRRRQRQLARVTAAAASAPRRPGRYTDAGSEAEEEGEAEDVELDVAAADVAINDDDEEEEEEAAAPLPQAVAPAPRVAAGGSILRSPSSSSGAASSSAGGGRRVRYADEA